MSSIPSGQDKVSHSDPTKDFQIPAFDIAYVEYAKTGRFSPLVCDYLNGNEDLMNLAAFPPTLNGINTALSELDMRSYPRTELAAALRNTYAALKTEPAVEHNIEALEQGAHVVVTAHQLNLFGGPLYLIYKTVSAIALANQLEKEFPDRNIVPVFWLGTEDHDFAEINHFRLFGKTLRWEREAGGSAGDLDLAGLDSVYAELDGLIGEGAHSDTLRQLFKEAYLQPGNLAEAQTRFLHALFGRHGLLVIHADKPEFKALFAPIVERELKGDFSRKIIEPALHQLESGWHVQAPPRDINLFYREPGVRERIEKNDQSYLLVESNRQWSEDQMLQMLADHPERFSPNVILRPIQQQLLLPAVAFLGGGAEVAYWLQLKQLFAETGVFMPVVMLRNSVLWLDAAGAKRLKNLDITIADLFLEEDALIRQWVHEHEQADLSLEPERLEIDKMYTSIADRSRQIDASLVGKIEAEKAAQLSALEKLEQRLVKASKQRHEVEVNQVRKLLAKYFPERGLQERSENFSSIWLRHGQLFVDALIQVLNPLDPRFAVVVEKD